MKRSCAEVREVVERYLLGHVGDDGLSHALECAGNACLRRLLSEYLSLCRDAFQDLAAASRRSKNGSKCNGYAEPKTPVKGEEGHPCGALELDFEGGVNHV